MRHGEGVNAVDLNGDDLPDLFLPSVREAARLLKNLGNGRFSDITASAGVAAKGGVGAAIGDLNNDGRPDIYIARGADPYVAPNLIYLQQADGTFQDASVVSGVADKSNGLTVTLADFNGDGAADAFLPGWGRDSLYLNRGDGRFSDVGNKAGLAASPWSMGAVSADFDNDGDVDLYVAGYHGPGRLYRNDGGMRFSDVTATAGITAVKVVGATSGPINGDLLPDLVLGGFSGPVELYKNLGSMKFVRVDAESGLAPVTRNEGLTLADLDDDGDLDLYVSNVEGKNRLYRNQLNDPRFLKLHFPGGGPSLVGAVARLSRAGKVLATQELTGAVGMGQGAQEILFRLPDEGPFVLVVTLPDGRRIEKQQVTPGRMRLPEAAKEN